VNCKIISTTGKLWRHGYGHGCQQCAGSYQLPRVTVSGQSLASQDASPPSTNGSQGNASNVVDPVRFTIHQPTRLVLPRIPKGARQRAASEFEQRLRAVVATPDNLTTWSNLFGFATLLGQPERGGSGRNLTSQVIKQLNGRSNYLPIPQERSAIPKSTAARKQAMSDDERAAKRASSKLQDGDIRGAVRCITSSDKLAPLTDDNYAILKAKHPPAPPDRRILPGLTSRPLIVTGEDIRRAIRSFAPGSAGGKDGLKPQHLKDLTNSLGGPLCDCLANFANIILAGGVPLLVRPFFFGASLLPFSKKEGGLRPIAVGLTLRRLVAKAAAKVSTPQCTTRLAPVQLGVGIRGGSEALVHAARRYLDLKSADQAFVKLDFMNAFNSIRRDSMLEAVASCCPDLLPFATSAYGSPSHLWIGDRLLSSEEGVQQGDPLGPLLFCLAVQPLLSSCQCELVTGYLDDVGIGDKIPHLINRIQNLEGEAQALGLTLNHSKCEIIGLAPKDIPLWRDSGLNFSITERKDACLLGAPLSQEGIDSALAANGSQLKQIEPRLCKLAAHEAFYLLKSCFAVPRLQYLLRSSPSFLSPQCSILSDVIRNLLSSILNIRFTDASWSQASLPVRWGGIGVRDVVTLAPSAFLGSLHATASLVTSILPSSLSATPDPLTEVAIQAWAQCGGGVRLQSEEAGRQRSWDDLVCHATFDKLIACADQVSRARLLASASPDSGAWLHALICRNLGLALTNRELRVAIGLRIGAPLVRPHTCVCGAAVEHQAHHGLSCKQSAGRQRRHAQANDVLVRAIRAVHVQAELEPHSLLRDDGRRPDGATLDPWSIGSYLVWDFTCPDTVAPSHVRESAITVGSAASNAEHNKKLKYAELVEAPDIMFSPVAVETLGTWGPSATALCREIGSRMAALSGDSRSHSFLLQRLALAVQRGNAAAVAGTHPSGDVASYYY